MCTHVAIDMWLMWQRNWTAILSNVNYFRFKEAHMASSNWLGQCISKPGGHFQYYVHYHAPKALSASEIKVRNKSNCLRRKWQPTPVFLSGKRHGHRSLANSPQGHKESDMTYWLNNNNQTAESCTPTGNASFKNLLSALKNDSQALCFVLKILFGFFWIWYLGKKVFLDIRAITFGSQNKNQKQQDQYKSNPPKYTHTQKVSSCEYRNE